MKSKAFILISLLALFAIITFYVTTSKHKNPKIIYPFNNTVFPAEFPSPTFRWNDPDSSQKVWEIKLLLPKTTCIIRQVVFGNQWKPALAAWDSLKQLSENGEIYAEVTRYNTDKNKPEGKTNKITFKISKDKVGAPILYREVVLPFSKAETMLDSMSYKLCNIGSPNAAHIAMKGFPVCGNCHSMSENGKTLALDLDAGNRDKGGYFIADVKDTIIFNESNYLSWTQIQNRNTFGMFSKISPDGRFIVTTMKDRIVIKNYTLNLPEQIEYSQLFFPVNGVLGIYDRKTGIIKELPGANDNNYVQTNAIWTPDCKHIIFARAKALPYYGDSGKTSVTNTMLIEEFASRKRKFKYDLYIVPFNEGRGGEATPIKGASQNGKSNYFPAISPNGKQLVFCQAENFMLLMPDSRLHLVNMENGESKELKCNFNSMNSWHAWSPNGKWLVYSSKGLSAYTDLFLTHIDDQGNASVPVLIETAHKENYAANYPEFINIDPSVKFNMVYDFIEMTHVKNALYKERNPSKAKEYFRQYLAQGQIKLASEFIEIARIGIDLQEYNEAKACLAKAAQLKGDKIALKSLTNIIEGKLKK